MSSGYKYCIAEAKFRALFSKYNVEFVKMEWDCGGGSRSSFWWGYYLCDGELRRVSSTQLKAALNVKNWSKGGPSNVLPPEEIAQKVSAKYGNSIVWTGYINRSGEMQFICEKHGAFYASKRKILYSACGCPQCAIEKVRSTRPQRVGRKNNGAINWSKLESDQEFASGTAVLYLVRISTDSERFYKVGISSPTSFYYRISRLEKYPNSVVELLRYDELTRYEAYELEQVMLDSVPIYKSKHKVEGYTEFFESDVLDSSSIPPIPKKFALTGGYYNDKRARVL